MGNIELLKGAMNRILEDPSKHDQTSWITKKYDEEGGVCGTTMCLAGYVAVEAKAELPNVLDPEWDGQWLLDAEGKLRDYYEENWGADGPEICEVAEWSEQKLGLTYEEKEYLFFGFVDAEQLKSRVDRVVQAWENGESYDPWAYGPCECGCEDED